MSIALATNGFITDQGYQFPPATPMIADATLDANPLPPIVTDAASTDPVPATPMMADAEIIPEDP